MSASLIPHWYEGIVQLLAQHFVVYPQWSVHTIVLEHHAVEEPPWRILQRTAYIIAEFDVVGNLPTIQHLGQLEMVHEAAISQTNTCLACSFDVQAVTLLWVGSSFVVQLVEVGLYGFF